MVYHSLSRNRGKSIGALLCLLILFVGLFTGCGSEETKLNFSDDSDAINEASASVVLLKCYDKEGNPFCTGSAFAAFEDGVFVTNYHVIEQDVYSIVAQTEAGIMFEMNHVLASDAEKDIAIISTEAKTGIAPLRIDDSDDIVKGEKVVAIGSPLGFVNTVSTGVYSGIIKDGKIDLLQFSAAISHGSSGGALFNDKGDIIGITSGSFEKGQNINIAMPIHYAIELKENAENPLTVEEFYETFNHYTEYTVAEVLEHRETILDSKAKVYGYVADIYEGNLYLVTNKSEIEECNMSSVDGATWGTDLYKLIMAQITAPKKTVVFLSKTNDSFCGLQIGDYVCISTMLSPQPDGQKYYVINAENFNNIIVIQ